MQFETETPLKNHSADFHEIATSEQIRTTTSSVPSRTVGTTTTGLAGTTTDARTIQTTSTTITTVTKRASKPALKPNPLICTAAYIGYGDKFRVRGIVVNPPDGLCDILVCDECVGVETNELKNYASRARQTGCGVSFSRQDVNKSNVAWMTGMLRNLWNSNIAFYGILDGADTSNTPEEAAEIVEFLKELQKQSHSFAVPVYAFAAVTVFPRSPANRKRMLINHVRELLSTADIDILVYQTSYRKGLEDDECVATGPAPWELPYARRQPSFFDTQSIRKRIQLPPGKVEAFGVTLMGIRTVLLGMPRNDSRLALGNREECLDSKRTSVPRYLCSSDSSSDDERFLRSGQQIHEIFISFLNRSLSMLVYDTSVSLQVKMCLARKQYGFVGGWVVHDVQWGFPIECAGHQEYDGLLQRVHSMRQLLDQKQFSNSCPVYRDYNEPPIPL
ncbi:uncharacterized protein LOC135388384 [Ornithodoros turicata]|uniref:uncharacterized protein LOC135388384 n=1 Tax=Ornithodoros turicata TaxID=34597 RepID=UPI0031391C60